MAIMEIAINILVFFSVFLWFTGWVFAIYAHRRTTVGGGYLLKGS